MLFFLTSETTLQNSGPWHLEFQEHVLSINVIFHLSENPISSSTSLLNSSPNIMSTVLSQSVQHKTKPRNISVTFSKEDRAKGKGNNTQKSRCFQMSTHMFS